MVDNQHEKIKGYRDLSESEIDAMNAFKASEVDMLKALDGIVDDENIRHVAMARSHFETGFMYAIKAIAKPAPYYMQVEEPEKVNDGLEDNPVDDYA